MSNEKYWAGMQFKKIGKTLVMSVIMTLFMMSKGVCMYDFVCSQANFYY